MSRCETVCTLANYHFTQLNSPLLNRVLVYKVIALTLTYSSSGFSVSVQIAKELNATLKLKHKREISSPDFCLWKHITVVWCNTKRFPPLYFFEFSTDSEIKNAVH